MKRSAPNSPDLTKAGEGKKHKNKHKEGRDELEGDFTNAECLEIAELVLTGRPQLADRLVFHVIRLKRVNESGPEGVSKVNAALDNWIRVFLPFSETVQALVQLCELQVDGVLTVDDIPLHVINAAISRGRQATMTQRVVRAIKSNRAKAK
jgi:hypothetical protein